MLELDTIRDPEALRRLAPEWQALMARAGPPATIFQSYDWAAACMTELEPGRQLCVLTARDHGRLVAIAPLMRDRQIGFATLRWLGGSLAIYGDVLADDRVDVPAWLRRALDQLTAQGEAHSLLLDNVRADARVAPFLGDIGRKSGSKSAPWIDLETLGTFEVWRARQSRATRRSRARRLKRLEAAGAVSFRFERAGSIDSQHAVPRLAELFAMKRDWAEGRHVISRTIHAPAFEAIVGALVTGKSCLDARLSVLLLDGKAISIELGFVVGRVYISYLGAYDPRFEAFSPGLLQLERTLEACFAEGLEAFDLQPPADAYKLSLACDAVPVSGYAAALTSLGRIHTTVAAVDPVGLAKSAIGLMPDSCRRLVYSAVQVMSGPSTTERPASLSGAKPEPGAVPDAASPRPAMSPLARRLFILLGAGAAVAAIVAD
jgi:CelD/BcsL family acetyltransferase involved in cellulose biosynthesis